MKTVYELSEADFKTALKEVLSQQVEDKILNRYEAITVDSSAACQILRISRPTLQRYIEAGLLEANQEAPGHALYFSLSYLLRINKKDLKSRYRNKVLNHFTHTKKTD